MVTIHLGPKWFFGIDASLEAFASLIAFCVTLTSYRIWKITKEKKYMHFTTSFLLLTLSFLTRAITDSLLEEIFVKIPAEYTGKVFFIGYVAHILLALIAYVTLFSVTHKIENKKVLTLIYLILIPSLLLSGSYFLSFYGLSAIFLSFITIAYYQNYKKVCKSSACLVFIAFTLLAFAQVFFLAEVMYKPMYVIAHITQAIGYVVLLVALIKTIFK